MNNIFDLHNADSRNIDKYIAEQIVDVTITSPPYFNLKDYGYKEQIGFGQKFERYLEDIEKVFSNVYNITKDTGSLWIIINTFKEGDKIIPLPFRVSDRLDTIGWKLQDIIIWSKDKTLPWTKKGQTKNKFEYILFFVKSKDFRYYSDRIRQYDTRHLKKWWIRYPERYNPKGKSSDEIWNYPIPTQGSWGNSYIKHFCPLPTDLIGNIIQLTTDEGDVVLDPFAGSGSVLAQAAYMQRKYIGFELNTDYMNMFENYLKKTRDAGFKNYMNLKQDKYQQHKFEKTILNLRALKYAKVMRNNLEKKQRDLLEAIYVNIDADIPKEPHKIIKVNYHILVKDKKDIPSLKQNIENQISIRPLSKFGIEPSIDYIFNKVEFINIIDNVENYTYTIKVTHRYKDVFDNIIKDFKIISPIKVELDEKDF